WKHRHEPPRPIPVPSVACGPSKPTRRTDPRTAPRRTGLARGWARLLPHLGAKHLGWWDWRPGLRNAETVKILEPDGEGRQCSELDWRRCPRWTIAQLRPGFPKASFPSGLLTQPRVHSLQDAR